MYMINHQQYHFIPQQMMPNNNGQLIQMPNNNNPHLNNQNTIAAYQQQQNQIPHNNNLMINNKVYIPEKFLIHVWTVVLSFSLASFVAQNSLNTYNSISTYLFCKTNNKNFLFYYLPRF
jgi:hypothetical protein